MLYGKVKHIQYSHVQNLQITCVLITMAERRITVRAKFTFTALRSALFVGLPFITDIFGRLDNRPHSLQYEESVRPLIGIKHHNSIKNVETGLLFDIGVAEAFSREGLFFLVPDRD